MRIQEHSHGNLSILSLFAAVFTIPARLFRFLQLPPSLTAGKAIIRPYTPTSPLRRQGSLDLIVKAYPEGNASKCVGHGCVCRPTSAKLQSME